MVVSMRSIHHIILAILVLAVISSFPAMAATYSFSEEDDGKTVNVSYGDFVKISLKENPSTGFRWIVATSGPLSLIREQYVTSNPDTMVAGAGGTRTWTYMVKGKGISEFHGIYKQSWMPTTGEEKTFTLTLNSAQVISKKPISLERFRRFP